MAGARWGWHGERLHAVWLPLLRKLHAAYQMNSATAMVIVVSLAIGCRWAESDLALDSEEPLDGSGDDSEGRRPGLLSFSRKSCLLSMVAAAVSAGL